MRDKAFRRGKAVRDRVTAAASAMKRKEEYLGARVPRELRERVIQRAHELGMPVSILIRNILEQAIQPNPPVPRGGYSTDAAIETGAVLIAANRFPNVLGWEEMLLNKSVNCAVCGIRLNPGASITIGLAGPGEEHVVLCQRCKQAT